MQKNNSTNKIINRISRIEGQLNGIKKMINDEKACHDVINQIMAIRSAVSSLGVEILKDDFICKKNISEIDERYLKTLFKI